MRFVAADEFRGWHAETFPHYLDAGSGQVAEDTKGQGVRLAGQWDDAVVFQVTEAGESFHGDFLSSRKFSVLKIITALRGGVPADDVDDGGQESIGWALVNYSIQDEVVAACAGIENVVDKSWSFGGWEGVWIHDCSLRCQRMLPSTSKIALANAYGMCCISQIVKIGPE